MDDKKQTEDQKIVDLVNDEPKEEAEKKPAVKMLKTPSVKQLKKVYTAPYKPLNTTIKVEAENFEEAQELIEKEIKKLNSEN